MTLLFAAFVGALVLLACAVALVLRQIFSRDRLPITTEWIGELSADRYRPMIRLLDEDELRFLRSQPGFTSGMESRVRSERCAIFRGYLESLQSDFRRTCTALKLVMAHSESDRPDLASKLLKAQMDFAAGVAVIQVQLAFYRFGIGRVDVGGLVRLFDGMSLQLRDMSPLSAGAAA